MADHSPLHPPADAAPTGGATDQSLADAFWLVARRLRRGTRDVLAPYDLSPSHSRALGVLLRHGPMRLNALSDHLHIAARSTTEVVDGLESRGFATRRPDPDDRRATLVEATDAGRDVMVSVRTAQLDEAGRLFGGLSARDRTDLARILRKLGD